MTLLLFLGQRYWGSVIARAVDRVVQPQDDVVARFVDQASYPRLVASRPSDRNLVFVRVGFRAGGTTPRARMFDAYWSLLRMRYRHARFCHYWIGTDVENTLTEVHRGTIRNSVLARARGELHVAAAPWLADELNTIGLTASVAFVPVDYRVPETAPALPDQLSVLTYLPHGRFEYYGGSIVLAAARALDDIRFDVVGGSAPDGSQRANVRWLGWVDDMTELYANCTVVLRIPRHDALGATVVEGLLHARHVIYTHRLPGVHHVAERTSEAVIGVLEGVRLDQMRGALDLNHEGRDWARATFDQHLLARRLLGQLLGAAG